MLDGRRRRICSADLGRKSRLGSGEEEGKTADSVMLGARPGGYLAKAEEDGNGLALAFVDNVHPGPLRRVWTVESAECTLKPPTNQPHRIQNEIVANVSYSNSKK